MKKVSIVVLTYNQENFIENNLRNIFSQKVNFPIELILSNDNSTDNTDAVIQRVIKDLPDHIKLVYTNHLENLGSTPNFYDALKKVTGDYIAFCEGDDYWIDDNKLQFQYDFLESNLDYSLCFHQTFNRSPDSSVDGTLFSKIENRDYSAFEIYKYWTVHTTSVFMRSIVLKNRVVEEMYKNPDLLYFDTILYMSASLNGKIRGFNKTMSAYLRHDVGLSHGINYKRDLRHNKLDEITGAIYNHEIKNLSNWLIFNRSRIAFFECLKKNDFVLAFKHLQWIMKKYKNLRIYLQRKYG